jgi:hypothetical protein
MLKGRPEIVAALADQKLVTHDRFPVGAEDAFQGPDRQALGQAVNDVVPDCGVDDGRHNGIILSPSTVRHRSTGPYRCEKGY